MSDTNSELIWYIARDGQQHGPLTDAEMRLFVDSGHLKQTDLVWNPSMTDWKSAAEIFPPPAPPAPPTPPAPPAPPESKTASPAPGPAAPVETGEEPTLGGPSDRSRQGGEPKEATGESSTGKPAGADYASSPVRSERGGREGEGQRYEPAERSYKPVFTGADPQRDTSGAAPSNPASTAGAYPAPDDVLPSLRSSRTDETGDKKPSASSQATGYTAGMAAGPAGKSLQDVGEHEDDDEDEGGGRGRSIGLLVGSFVLAAVVAGGGLLAYQNQDAILSYMNSQPDEAPPVVKAEGADKAPASNQQTASLDKDAGTPAPRPEAPKVQPNLAGPDLPGITVTIPPTQPATPPSADAEPGVPLQTIDSNLQKSQLWQVVKQEFPDWYGDRVKEISRMSGSASEAELSKHLIGKLVALRREHAQFALASDTDHLRNIATAFLANLKSLAGHSTEACYTFISRGETSPDVISLFPKPGYGDAIEGQIAAVFRAVAAGRKAPVSREKATKPDYDVLAQELTKIGWSKEDLGLFANPQALAKAPQDRVCRMVQDWFSAHVSISDKGVQERLLVETLRPVIAG